MPLPPAPMGARGERPVFLPCAAVSGTWLSGILEIPGVQKVSGGIRCTWDVAWAVARLLKLPEPEIPKHDGPLPGLERYRALGLHEKTYPRQKEDILFLARRAAAILAEPMRCISGSAKLVVWQDGHRRRRTLASIVERFEAGEETWALSVDAEGRTARNRVVAVHRAGAKTAYRVRTIDGREIVASEDHAFSTPEGFARLGDLGVWDKVHVVDWYLGAQATTHITSIAVGEPEAMFDLTMEGPHNYVAEGFVVHNSGKSLMALGASVLIGAEKTLIVCPEYARLGWADEVARWVKAPALLLCGRGGREARLRCMTCGGRKVVDGGACPDCRARNGQSLGCILYTVPELRYEDGVYRCTRHPDVKIEGVGGVGDDVVVRCRLCYAQLHQAIRDAQYVIVNYELLVKQHTNVGGGRVVGRTDLAGWVDTLKQYNFDICIADEAHMLRGWSTSTKRRSGEARNERFLDLVGHVGDKIRIPRVWMVTGTPFYGFVRDVFWLLECATGGLWGGDTRLRGRKYMVRYAGGTQTAHGFQAKDRTIYAETELMRRLVGTTDAEGRRNFDGLMVQRPREELFTDVPPMRHQVVYLELDVADASVKRSRDGIGAAITALNALKLEALMDRFLDELAEGNKIIVFTYHVASAKRTFLAFEKALQGNAVRTRMQQVNARVWLATGPKRDEAGEGDVTSGAWATSGEQRYRLAEVYREHVGAGVLVATIDALPGALSLRGASSVHFLDLHWSPGAIAQAENRPWHPEVKDLQVVYYVVRETVDEHVAAEVLPKVETLARMGRDAGAAAMLDAFGRKEEERTLESIYDRLTRHLDAENEAEDDDAA